MSADNKVAGIELQALQDPIAESLYGYYERSGGSVMIDYDQASKLQLTPAKPNSARSVAPVHFNGEQIATAYTIAFAPGDGTGDENTYKLDEIDTGRFPAVPAVVPRSKAAVDCEIHIPLLTVNLEPRKLFFVPFAGNLALLGFIADKKLDKIDELGQKQARFVDAFELMNVPAPMATLTTDVPESASPEEGLSRFGDPHAVYNNRRETLQIATFIALEAGSPKEHRRAFAELGISAQTLNI